MRDPCAIRGTLVRPRKRAIGRSHARRRRKGEKKVARPVRSRLRFPRVSLAASLPHPSRSCPVRDRKALIFCEYSSRSFTRSTYFTERVRAWIGGRHIAMHIICTSRILSPRFRARWHKSERDNTSKVAIKEPRIAGEIRGRSRKNARQKSARPSFLRGRI